MPIARHVILFLIDGLRPDALSQTDTPHMDRLASRGAFSWQAQTVTPSVTLPCLTSLFQAVPPDRHGILDNEWTPREPRVPGMMEVAHQAGLGTGAFYTWEPIRNLTSLGVLDIAFFRREGAPEDECMPCTHALAASRVVEEEIALTFLYDGAVDTVGHRHGWMSARYLHAVSRADRGIGHVLGVLASAGMLEDTVFVVLGDHGGHSTKHGEGLVEDVTIPWIISGPGIRHGHEILRPVNIMDTAPTVAHLLGITAPTEWCGQVIADALLP
jgi:predicted AlkP superfamily pyrophosphatase or phosphodiesterase